MTDFELLLYLAVVSSGTALFAAFYFWRLKHGVVWNV